MHAPLLNLFQGISRGGGGPPCSLGVCQLPAPWAEREAEPHGRSISTREVLQAAQRLWTVPLNLRPVGPRANIPHPDCKCYIQLLLPNSSRSFRNDACHIPSMLPEPACSFYFVFLTACVKICITRQGITYMGKHWSIMQRNAPVLI